jgi:predicted nuclease of predicted toxin-antitoxin system
MKFLANENVPGPTIRFLRDNKFDLTAISEISPGLTDNQVMEIATLEERIIITHDSDYGELIFKHGHKPSAGVIYFRLVSFEPDDPAKIILNLLKKDLSFANKLTVIDSQSIRQRSY